MELCSFALMRRATGPRNHTHLYEFLNHIAFPRFLGKWKVDAHVFQLSRSVSRSERESGNTRASTLNFSMHPQISGQLSLS